MEKAVEKKRTAEDYVEIVKDFVYGDLHKYVKSGAKVKELRDHFKSGSCVWAAIIFESKDSKTTELISFATGSKSMPQSSLKDRSKQLTDMHAESIAKRCMIDHLLNTYDSSAWLISDKVTGKKIVNANVIMVCSKMPCGDMSIDRCDGEKMFSNGMMLDKYKKMKEMVEKGETGEKSKGGGEEEEQKEFEFRIKPARPDLPFNQIYPILSCSDKLLKWNTVGVQGKLSKLLVTFRITDLVVPIPSESSRIPTVSKLQKTLLLSSRSPPPLPKSITDFVPESKVFPVHHPRIHVYLQPPTILDSSIAYSMAVSKSSSVAINVRHGIAEGSSLKNIDRPLLPLCDQSIGNRVDKVGLQTTDGYYQLRSIMFDSIVRIN